MPTKRPIIVSIISALIAIELLFVLKPLVLSLVFGVYIWPQWYEIVFLCLIILKLYSLVEIWKIKKRGLELLMLFSIIAWIVDLSMGYSLGGYAFFIDLIALIVLLTQYKKFSQPSFLKRA